MESKSAHAKGMIVRKYQSRYSNFRAQDSLDAFLVKHNVMGICDVDTRFLTKMIRSEGAMMMVASSKISDKDELKKILENSPRIEDVNYIKERSLKPRSNAGEWVSSITFAIIAATLVHTYFMQPYTIPTSSLEKTLLIGDFLFVSKFHYGARAPMTTVAAPMVHDTIPSIPVPYTGIKLTPKMIIKTKLNNSKPERDKSFMILI